MGSTSYHLRAPAAIAAMRAIDSALTPLRQRRPQAPPVAPERILVAQWAHLGDVLLALPAMAALRARYPDARIDLLAGGAAAPLALGGGIVDTVHRLDHWSLDRSGRPIARRWARYLRDAAAMCGRLRAIRYDVSIDLYGWFPNTSALCRAAGIPVRIGFASGGGGPLLTHPVPWPAGPVHVSRAPEALLRVLDSAHDWGDLAPCWPGPVAAPADAGAGTYVLVHTGTGERSREWPESKWTALLAAMRRAGLPVRVAGAGASECQRASRLAAAVPGVVDASGTDWPGYLALVRDARLVICLESSCAHLAAALARPTVCLFGHVNDPARWGPRNAALTLVRPRAAVPGHALTDLEPEAVWNAVREALDASPCAENRPSPRRGVLSPTP